MSKKKTRSGYCLFAQYCDKKRNCLEGPLCDAFELAEHIAPLIEESQCPVSMVDQFHKQVRFESYG